MFDVFVRTPFPLYYRNILAFEASQGTLGSYSQEFLGKMGVSFVQRLFHFPCAIILSKSDMLVSDEVNALWRSVRLPLLPSNLSGGVQWHLFWLQFGDLGISLCGKVASTKVNYDMTLWLPRETTSRTVLALREANCMFSIILSILSDMN